MCNQLPIYHQDIVDGSCPSATQLGSTALSNILGVTRFVQTIIGGIAILFIVFSGLLGCSLGLLAFRFGSLGLFLGLFGCRLLSVLLALCLAFLVLSSWSLVLCLFFILLSGCTTFLLFLVWHARAVCALVVGALCLAFVHQEVLAGLLLDLVLLGLMLVDTRSEVVGVSPESDVHHLQECVHTGDETFGRATG